MECWHAISMFCFAFIRITFNCIVAHFSDTKWLLVIYWNLIDACVYVMAVVYLLL